VVQIVTEDESNRASKALAWPDADVQVIIKESEDAFIKRAQGILVGSFVRILDGPMRDYCGIVDAINDGTACVRIDMKTRSVVVETPIRNLVDLNHVPENQRVFYYGPLIADMIRELGAEGLALLTEDLHFNPNESNISKLDELPIEPEEKTETIVTRRHSRQNTVTALVKKLIFEKTIDPLEIAKKIVEAIKAGTVKPPKNLFIVYCLPRTAMMQGIVPFYVSEQASSVLDHNGDLQVLTDHMQRPYDGPMTRIKIQGTLPLEITPEHEVLVLRSKRKWIVKGKRLPERPTWARQQAKNWEFLWVPSKDVEVTDFMVCPEKFPAVPAAPEFTVSEHHLAKTINIDIQPDRDLAWLFGQYVADGGISGTRETGEGIGICINAKTDQQRLKRAFGKLGIENVRFRASEKNTCTDVLVSSVSLVETFREWFGADCYTKRIPAFLYTWGEKYLREFIDGYAEGDGSNTSTRQPSAFVASTVSQKLAFQVWHILVLLKCHPSLKPYRDGVTPEIIFGQEKVGAPSWSIWWTDPAVKLEKHDTFYYGGYYCMPVKSVDAFHFQGDVFNKSVANTETYIVNGVVAHNCIIKNHLMRFHFRSDPDLTTYRDVIRKHGKTFKFSAKDIAKLDPSGIVPIRTKDVCKDGRSRESRLKKKRESQQQDSLSIQIKDGVLSIKGEKPKDASATILTSAKWLIAK
jgi:intein/homing endonuclease